MRFLKLDLRDYGPFVNAEPIPLDRGSLGLHLIQGPNEAGKSTAVRAIRALLFGFPKSTGDGHGRDYGSLRVGAAIQGVNETELSFVRRKRDVRPLWTFDDSAPIDPDSLLPFLGGLDEDRFLDLFSMDHAELVAGGRSILGGGGRLGEMLFAAGSGLAPVDEVRRTLDEEMGRLFRPRASTSSINAALVDLAEGRRAVDRAVLATSAWVELDAEIDRGRRRLAEVEGEWRRADAEKRRLERLRKALPMIARLEDVVLKLERLEGVPVLSEGFAELRRAESLEFDIASKEARDSASAIEEIGRELAEIGPPDPVLAEADAIGQLQRDLGVYLKEARERPAREAKLSYIEANARSRMSGLFPGGSVDDPGRLRAVAARRGPIQELAQQFGLLEASCRKADADVAGLVDSLSGIGDEPPAPDAPRLAKSLAEGISRITALGDLDRQLDDARAELAEAEQEAAIMLRALPLWSGSLDDLEALAVPPPATIDRFESDLRGLDEAIGRAGASLAQFEADRLAIEREMDGVQLAGRVPTEEELEARRSDRDNSWRLVRRAWLDGHPVGDPPALAAGYEADVRSADELADRLRREADRVAAQAQRRADHRGLLARIAALMEDLDRRKGAKAEALDDWAGFWRPLGIDPLPPER